MTAFLQIQRLRKTYDDVVAIDHVSLDVRKGEFMTFLGPSGSGKSTTLYIVAGFQEPTEGRVLLDGKPLLAVTPNKRNIGMVFQRYTLFPHLTGNAVLVVLVIVSFAFPCIRVGLPALPLCGAAPTFLCRGKEK